MTTPTPYTGAPVSTASESPDWPASLWAYANTIDDQHVLYATSQANRDALYANVRAGAIVSCAALGIVWQKKTTPPTAAAWITLAEVGTVATSGIITANSPTFTTTEQHAQRINGFMYMTFSMTYSGSDLVAASNGNVTDTLVGTLGSAYWPNSGMGNTPRYLSFGIPASSGGTISVTPTSGAVTLTSLYPGTTLTAGNVMRFDIIHPGA